MVEKSGEIECIGCAAAKQQEAFTCLFWIMASHPTSFGEYWIAMRISSGACGFIAAQHRRQVGCFIVGVVNSFKQLFLLFVCGLVCSFE
jgi:hypothetical protein